MAIKLIQTKPTTLSYGINDSATSMRLENLLKLDGSSIQASDIGDILYGTFDPGTSREEIFSIDGAHFTVNADGTVDITNVVRGLKEVDPYDTGGFATDHPAGAVVIFGDNPQLFKLFATKSGDNTFTGDNIFAKAPQSQVDPVSPNDLTRLSYIQALILGTLTTINVIVPGTGGANIIAGQSVYFDDATNKWKLTDATNAATVEDVLLGIAQGAGSDGNPIVGGVLLQGVDAHQTGLTDGQTQYASDTPGAIATTPGTVSVVLGISKGTTQLYFAPRFNQQVTANQLAAMAGTSGTPSNSNRFVTNNDTSATAVANKIYRLLASGKIDATLLEGVLPALSGVNLTNIPTLNNILNSINADETNNTYTTQELITTATGTGKVIYSNGMAVNDITNTSSISLSIMGRGASSWDTLSWSLPAGKIIKIKFTGAVNVSGGSGNGNTLGFGLSSENTNIPSITETADHSIKFAVNNSNEIFAVASDGSGNTNINTAITGGVNSVHVFEIIWIVGTSAKFYIDGVLKATITTNLPTTGAINFIMENATTNFSGNASFYTTFPIISQSI